MTVSDLETIILTAVPPFQRYATGIEAEPVGKVQRGQYVRRTLSFLLVPMMTAAILGTHNASKYFPKLPTMFDELVGAIRTVLRSGIAIYQDDVTTHPHNRATLYFSSRLQDAVLEGLNVQFMTLYYQLEQWIQERFNNESRGWYQRASGGAADPGIHNWATTAPQPIGSSVPRTSNVPPPRILPTTPDLNTGGIQPSEMDPYAAWRLPDRSIQQLQTDIRAHPGAPPLIQPSTQNLHRAVTARANKILKEKSQSASFAADPLPRPSRQSSRNHPRSGG